jgi:2,4-dienoyl-CoA reductase-like NADH-dependent reductase (Old Yellow Enzyme family)/thioredoxin reductase
VAPFATAKLPITQKIHHPNKEEIDMFEYLSKPAQIGTLHLSNRMVQPGMGTNLAAADGTVSDIIADYYTARGKSGVGLIITEVCCPEPRGRVIPGELEISSYAFLPGLSRLPNAAHAGGAKIALQLAHGGCFASASVTGEQPISPSGVGTALLPEDEPKAMTLEEIEELVEAYGLAAQRARMAGFDAVEIHGAHGYMPLQFLSGYTNRRTDEYGGSFENRARFPLEVVEAVKRLAGPDFPVIYRLSAEEDVPDGVTLDEAVAFAKLAQEVGVDAIHVSAGTWDSRMQAFGQVMQGEASPEGKRLSEGVSIGMWVPPLYVPRGNLVPLAAAVKAAVDVPVIAVCGLSPELGEDVLAQGKADLVSLGRQIIADPQYPNKVLAGKPEEIRRCVRCNECLGSVMSYRGIDCAVNAEVGKEHEAFGSLQPAALSRQVMVIGGGPAGMEAARVAALRGHDVTLYEKRGELGGMMRYAAIPEFKKDYRDFLAWQVSELERQGVTVELDTEVTAEQIEAEAPDVVIVATGARMAYPEIEGVDAEEVYDALQVLEGDVPAGEHVVVCGAGLAGSEVAMFLAEQHDKRVTLVDQLSLVVPEVETFTRWVVLSRLVEDGVDIRLNHCIECITDDGVSCTCAEDTAEISGDAVVLALGMTPNTTLLEEIRALPLDLEVIAVGDAVQARKVLQAVHEGYHAARRI